MARHHRHMAHRAPLLYDLPPFVDMPTGNVQVLPSRHDDDPAIAPVVVDGTPLGEWFIRDVAGLTVDTVTGGRALALRRMGELAGHGAGLPLSLYGADGLPTGDRLPG